MTSLYRYEVGTYVQEDGVASHCLHGQPVTVNGSPMVSLPNGVIVPAAGWFATEAEAADDASQRINDMARALFKQALLMISVAVDKEAAT